MYIYIYIYIYIIYVYMYDENNAKWLFIFQCRFNNNLGYKKRKNSLEGSLERVLFAAELELPKILVPRLPQISSNVNICARKLKQLYSECDQLHGALIYPHINLFFIDYTCCKLCNKWLLLF